MATERPTVPWGLGTVGGSVLISGFVGLVVAAAVLGAFRAFFNHHVLAADLISYQFLVAGVLLSAVLLILVRYEQGGSELGYRLPNAGKAIGAALLGLLIAIIGIVVIYNVFDALLPQFNLHGNAKQLFTGLPKHPAAIKEVVLGLWVSVEAPIAEETLFRGIIFQGVRRFFDDWLPYQVSVLLGAIVSGTIFGLAHGELHTLPILIFLGIVLAYVFQISRSIFASMLLHGLFNFVAFSGTFLS
ncbi:MAG: lysostaphin resistance A-like protein [Chloroflexota bacterium]